MPARASYEVRIEGLIPGRKTDNKQAIAWFQDVFPQKAPSGGTGELGGKAVWPSGFVLKPVVLGPYKEDYRACSWESNGYDYDYGRTLLSFRAEVSIFLDGAIYDSAIQRRLLDDVTWFYTYRDHDWYKAENEGLQARLRDLNTKLEGIEVIERVRFREWRWYCGNGGGGGD